MSKKCTQLEFGVRDETISDYYSNQNCCSKVRALLSGLSLRDLRFCRGYFVSERPRGAAER